MPAAQPEQIPPTGLNPATFDIGNALLDEGEYQMTATVVTHPVTGEQRLIATFRSSSATFTAFLSRDKADTWRAMLEAKITKMSTLVLGGVVPDARPGPVLHGPNGEGSRM